jgi:hypothetical protein
MAHATSGRTVAYTRPEAKAVHDDVGGLWQRERQRAARAR